MNDFDYENMLKKRLASSASHRKRGSKSRKCCLSTDHMTRKEWEKMNGDTITYQFGIPMAWDNFKKMPMDIQKEYVKDLVEKYNPSSNDLARFLNTSGQTLRNYLKKNNFNFKFTHGHKMTNEKKNLFEKVLNGNLESLDTTTPDIKTPAIRDLQTEISESVSMLSDVKMCMSEFTISFQGFLDSNMVANTLKAILNKDKKVHIDIKCQVVE